MDILFFLSVIWMSQFLSYFLQWEKEKQIVEKCNWITSHFCSRVVPLYIMTTSPGNGYLLALWIPTIWPFKIWCQLTVFCSISIFFVLFLFGFASPSGYFKMQSDESQSLPLWSSVWNFNCMCSSGCDRKGPSGRVFIHISFCPSPPRHSEKYFY